MFKLKSILFISAATLILAACGVQGEATQAIPEVPSGPSPAIEIIAGSPNTCEMADTSQSTVMGFDVDYRNVGTDAYMVGIMTAPDVGEIGSVGAAGEGLEGEGGWGIYPQAYKLPPYTPITLEITVYAGSDETAPVSSISSLTYDCTRGDTISATFVDSVNNPDAHTEPGWEDEFVVGCESNGGLPFEWDYGIGCDFEAIEDVFCNFDDKCDAGLLVDLELHNLSGDETGNLSGCDDGEIITISSVSEFGEVSVEEVCATGTSSVSQETGGILNAEVSTAGVQAIALENEDDQADLAQVFCKILGGKSKTRRNSNGGFRVECYFPGGQLVVCDSNGCYPSDRSAFCRKEGDPNCGPVKIEEFLEFNAFIEEVASQNPVAISDDDLDDLTEICQFDGGNAGTINDELSCFYPDTSQEWECHGDFLSAGGIKCEQVFHEDPEGKNSETSVLARISKATLVKMRSMNNLTFNVAISDDALDDFEEMCKQANGDATETTNRKQFFCTFEEEGVDNIVGWFCEDAWWLEEQVNCGPLVADEPDEPDEKKSETDQSRFPGEALNALDGVSIIEEFIAPGQPPSVPNPVLLVQDPSCKVGQDDGVEQSSAKIFIHNILEMNGFYESIVGQNGIIAPNNLTGQEGGLDGYQGTGGANVATNYTPINIIVPNNLAFDDISDGTSKTLMFNIIAPNNFKDDYNGSNNPYTPITILIAAGLGVLAGGLYLTRMSNGLKIMEFIAQQPKQLAMGAGVGFGVSILTAGIGLAALFFMSNTAPENIAVGCNAVVVQTAKLDYLIAQPEKQVEVLTVTANQPTNCRHGAGTYFPKLDSFDPTDDPAIVLGQNATHDWYFIEKNTGSKCWVWAEGLEDVSHLGDVDEVANPPLITDESNGGGGGSSACKPPPGTCTAPFEFWNTTTCVCDD